MVTIIENGCCDPKFKSWIMQVCISHRANTFRKGMNLIIFPQSTSKWKRRLGMATSLGERKPVELHLKN